MVHDFCRTCHTYDGSLRGILVNFTGNKGVVGAGSLPDGGDIGGINGGGVCSNCHTAAAPAFHHATNYSAVGDCEHCHDDPRDPVPQIADWNATLPGDIGANSGVNVPTQLACKECHTRLNTTGTNLIVQKFTRTDYNTYAAQEWTKSNIHTIPTTAGVNINNYGICFDCHDTNLTDTAPLVNVWHSRPDMYGPAAWNFPSQSGRSAFAM